jgi:hypothetical protein
MARHRRRGVLQNVITLVLLGALAGALGGVAVGIMTSRSNTSTVTTAQ